MGKIQTKCIYCGYEFEADEFMTECYCQSCGQKLRIENGVALVNTDADDRSAVFIENPIKNYNTELQKWKKSVAFSTAIKAVVSFTGWICMFTSKTTLGIFLTFISIMLLLAGPAAIASKEPNGSLIPNSEIKAPKKGRTALKYYAIFLLIGLMAFLSE